MQAARKPDAGCRVKDHWMQAARKPAAVCRLKDVSNTGDRAYDCSLCLLFAAVSVTE